MLPRVRVALAQWRHGRPELRGRPEPDVRRPRHWHRRSIRPLGSRSPPRVPPCRRYEAGPAPPRGGRPHRRAASPRPPHHPRRLVTKWRPPVHHTVSCGRLQWPWRGRFRDRGRPTTSRCWAAISSSSVWGSTWTSSMDPGNPETVMARSPVQRRWAAPLAEPSELRRYGSVLARGLPEWMSWPWTGWTGHSLPRSASGCAWTDPVATRRDDGAGDPRLCFATLVAHLPPCWPGPARSRARMTSLHDVAVRHRDNLAPPREGGTRRSSQRCARSWRRDGRRARR